MEDKKLVALMAAIISTTERVRQYSNWSEIAVNDALEILSELDKKGS